MIKVMWFLKRAEHLSLAEFRRWWLEEHVPDIIADQQPLLTLNAGEDETWDMLGIQNLARAASLRDSALVPLLASRRLIGFLQLSNHKQGVIAFSGE